MGSENKEGSKEENTRIDRQKPTQQGKTDYQSDRVRRQLHRTKSVVVQHVPDKLRNRKAKTGPEVLDVESHLARGRIVNPTIGSRDEQPKLLRDAVLLPEPIDVWPRK